MSSRRTLSRSIHRFRPQVEMLEARLVPCLDPWTGLDDGGQEAHGAPAIVDASLVELAAGTTAGSTGGTTSGGPLGGPLLVPQLQSKPGASNVIFLDFDGDSVSAWRGYRPGTIPAYSIDGDATTFSSQELANIRAIWQIVAENYAPFNVNVTTIDPRTWAGFKGHVSRKDIGGNGAWTGGFSWVGGFGSSTASNPARGFVFADNLTQGSVWYTAAAATHEAGHTLGLRHQSSWSGKNKTAEYQRGPGDGTAPIEGSSYSASRGMWWYGRSSLNATTYQNDMSILASALGYRADEAGSTATTATALTVSSNTASAAGYITTMADVDVWSFTTAPGTASFTVNNQSYGGSKFGNLTPKIRLLDSSGNVVVGWQDPNRWTVSWSGVLAGGSYRLVVASHGIYGGAQTSKNYGFNVGSYTITGTLNGVADVVSAPGALTATAASTSQINLSWADNATNEIGYSVERSTDGSNFTQVADLDSNSTSYIDTGLAAQTTYYYRVRARAEAFSDYSNQASATTKTPLTPPAAPGNATASLEHQAEYHPWVTVRWTDNATNETGYGIQRSDNGGTLWKTLPGSLGANTTTYLDKTVSSGSSFIYRIFVFNGAGAGYTTTAAITPSPFAAGNSGSAPTAALALSFTAADNSGYASTPPYVAPGQFVAVVVEEHIAVGTTSAAAAAPEDRAQGNPDTSASAYRARELRLSGQLASALYTAAHKKVDLLEVFWRELLRPVGAPKQDACS